MFRRWINVLTVIAFFCWCASLGQSMAKDHKDVQSKESPKSYQESKETAKKSGADKNIAAMTTRLGGSTRYLTALNTDKPIYKAGDLVYMRGVLLDAADQKPLTQAINAQVEVKGPKGETVMSAMVTSQDGVWGESWKVPATLSGGEYKVRVSYSGSGVACAPAERKIDIRAVRNPRLNSQITFQRDGYGPGDNVTATLDVKRAEGGVPTGAKVTVDARVDGVDLHAGTSTVDDKGLCKVSFALPKQIERGEGTLALIVEDGGVVETASKTIPILLQTVDLQMYPEGGDLLAGFSNRVYFQAHQTNGKPADLAAKLMFKHGGQSKVVTELRSEHEGRGRFEFTPEAKGEYFLTISEPAGIKKTFALPPVKISGAVIRSDKNVYDAGEPIALQIGGSDKNLRVAISKRENELVSTAIKVHSGKAGSAPLTSVSLTPPATSDGVLIATVFDGKDKPLAERLIYRKPAGVLNIIVSADRKKYMPGDCAKITVKTTDSDGKPVSAMVGLTATDRSILELVDKREQAPNLPVMVFLEPEVKDLADASVYLDPKNSRAPLATDLLLGTQGWRRFAMVDVDKFVRENGDDAKRALAFGYVQTPVLAPASVSHRTNGALRGRPAEAPIGTHVGALNGKAPAMDPRWHYEPNIYGAEAHHRAKIQPHGVSNLALPKDIGQIEGPRDVNLLQVEPTVIDERHYSSGRAERHQKTSPTLPEGAPIPDNDGGDAPFAGAAANVDRFAYFHNIANNVRGNGRIVAGRIGQPNVGQVAIVREYAHPIAVGRTTSDRNDFVDTVYWNAGLKTDATTGEATVAFGLNDSVSSFKVSADGYTTDGAIGAAASVVEAVQPFYAEAKMPLEVTAGDQILLPVNLVNGTDNGFDAAEVKLTLPGDFKLADLQKSSANIAAGGRVRWIQPITVGVGNGPVDLTVMASAGTYNDKVARKMTIRPQGFPEEIAVAGVLQPGMTVVHTVKMAAAVAPGSLTSTCALYPTPLANMTEALQRLIQDPNGCFEQTSSTSYPLTMAQQYFLTHQNVDPALVTQSREKLDAGYKKLLSFWCPDRGYEWYGENPGHEALTAFGLMHFKDMEKVRDVDQNMVEQTRKWLLAQKDGQGGFSRKRRSLHTWIEDKDCSNAYICWALLECGQPASDLTAELASLKSAADSSQNNYVVALAANAFALSGDKAEATKLMDRLSAKQKADGSVDDVKSSIVGSGGEALEIEGSSLATLAWMREPKYASNVEKSIKFLADSCKAGRYGSTQSTVLALRTIVAYDQLRAHPKAAGKVRVFVDGQPVGDWISFNKETQSAIKLPDVSELLTPGEHKIELRMEGGSAMPYSIAAKYNSLTPASDSECTLDLAVKMAQDKVVEGGSTEANVLVTNKSDKVIPNPIAIIGLPGGLEPRHDQLKELVKKGTIDAYEVRGRDIVLYWRSMAGDAKVAVPLSVIAAIPGKYTGAASRTYLYYTDEHKRWADGLKVEIAAK